MEFVHPRKWVEEAPHKPALVMATSGQVVTRLQLEESANRCAHMLRHQGLKAGDCIAIYMENDPRFIEVASTASRSGLLYTPISTHLTIPEVEYIVNECGAKVFFTSAAKGEVASHLVDKMPNVVARLMVNGTVEGYGPYEDKVSGYPVKPISRETFGDAMLYSSGTTGRPKGIKLTLGPTPYGELYDGAKMLIAAYGLNRETVYLSPAPLYHAITKPHCPRLETAWSTAASQTLSRIEFLRILEQPDASAFSKLTAYLNIQWSLSEFSNLLILDADNQVIFHHGSESASLKGLFGEQATWLYVPQSHQLYRVFQMPVWLGKRGQGRLVLFKTLSNSTLRELVIPQAALQLSYHDQLVAQSHDPPPPSGANALHIQLPWPAVQADTGADKGPVLEIYREIVDQLPYSSFILRTAGAIVLLSLLIWLSVGRWLARIANRIETLGKGARLYAEGADPPALVAELEPARQNQDEIGETAVAFEQMMDTIQSRVQEQQYYLETLSLLEAYPLGFLKPLLCFHWDPRILDPLNPIL